MSSASLQFFVRAKRPARFQHVGMVLIRSIHLFQFVARIARAAQPQPADGGVEVMRVGRFQFLHGLNFTGFTADGNREI